MHSSFASISMAERTNGNSTAFPCNVDGRLAPYPYRDRTKMEHNVSFAFSSSPAGPWSCCPDVQLDVTLKNPSLLIHLNGTAVLVWLGPSANNGSRLMTARADSVRGKFTVVGATGAVANPVVVDPQIMWLAESQSYHVDQVGLGGGALLWVWGEFPTLHQYTPQPYTNATPNPTPMHPNPTQIHLSTLHQCIPQSMRQCKNPVLTIPNTLKSYVNKHQC